MRGYVTHRFFCTNCGKEGIPIARKKGHLHSALHQKKLYCIHCKQEYNHIECINELEVQEFKELFDKGAFKDEKENISSVGSAGLR